MKSGDGARSKKTGKLSGKNTIKNSKKKKTYFSVDVNGTNLLIHLHNVQ